MYTRQIVCSLLTLLIRNVSNFKQTLSVEEYHAHY